jgi:hypothetical protein
MTQQQPEHPEVSDSQSRANSLTPPHWEVTVSKSGSLTAVLVGTHPPLTVTAPDLATLREQIKTLIMRAML